MQRFIPTIALAVLAGAAVASPARAQYVVAQPQVLVPAPVVTTFSPPPVVAVPAVTHSYYAAPAVTHSYYAAPATVTYSAPATVAVPVVGTTTRTYRGYGVFRPRGLYTETYPGR